MLIDFSFIDSRKPCFLSLVDDNSLYRPPVTQYFDQPTTHNSLEPGTLDDLHELQSLMGGSMMQTKRQNSAGNISNSASEVGVRVLGAGRLTVDNLPYHDPTPESELPDETSFFKASISCLSTPYSLSFRPRNAVASDAFSATPLGVRTYK